MAYTTIDDPTIYFNIKLYTGNGTAIGSGGQAITGVGFQPDWVWVKSRSLVDSHQLYDVVRGGTKGLRSNTNAAEGTNTEFLSTFDSDGFTVGNNSKVNQNSETYVAWNWKAGGSASSNSNGSITTSVSASTDAGFSIVSWTGNGTDGASIGHGLVNPNLCIIKRRDASGHGWFTGGYPNTSLFSNDGDHLNLESINALSNSSTKEIDLSTDSGTTCTFVDAGNDINLNGGSFIGYFFKNIKGYSKVGSYVGNGTDGNGTYIYCGFRPAYILIKSTASSTNWPIIDNKRPGYNPANQPNNAMFANTDSAASSSPTRTIDLNSQGFKIRGNNNDLNASGNTFLFYAVAESPFVNSNGIPTNAR